MKIKDEWIQNNGKYKCPECSKEYTKKGIGTHLWRMHGKGKGFEIWNKGLSKETSEIIRINAKSVSDYNIKNNIKPSSWKGKKHTQQAKRKIAESAKGNTNGLGRGKITYYKDVMMRSSWEASVAEYLDDHNIVWEYEKKAYSLSSTTSYRPDFFILDSNGDISYLIEVKGYFREQNKIKFENFKKTYPHIKIELWDKDELQKRDII